MKYSYDLFFPSSFVLHPRGLVILLFDVSYTERSLFTKLVCALPRFHSTSADIIACSETMGQGPSQPARGGDGVTVISTVGIPAAPREKSPDPFHRSPISPVLYPTSNHPPPPPPAAPTLETRPSFIKLRKAITPEATNLPKPPTSSFSRVVRKISKNRKDLATVRAGSGSALSSTPPPATLLQHPDFRPSSYGRYPPSLSNPKLSSSLGSSTLSGPSTSLVTPSASRRNLISPIPVAPCTPAHQIMARPPTHHRQGSSTSSSRSPSAPGKTAAHPPRTRTRAEREWRARVAAISAGAKARGAGLENGDAASKGKGEESPAYKGPVPPRRRGGPQASISAVPPAPLAQSSTNIPHLTPRIVLPDSPTLLRRSLSSARSFETLGHHAHRPSSLAAGSPSHVQYRSVPLRTEDSSPLSHHRGHSRKGSLPQSIGSFYADPNSRGGTRPNSLATSTFFSPHKRAEEAGESDEKAVLAGDAEVEEEDEIPLGMGAGGMARLSKEAIKEGADDLLFDMAINSPQFTPPKTTPLLSSIPARPTTPVPSTLSTSSRTPTRNTPDVHLNLSAEPATPPTIGFGQGPETPRSRARKERILSLPSIDTSPQRTSTRAPLPPLPLTSQISNTTSPTLQADTSAVTDGTSPSLPSLLSYTLSTPTPTRQTNSGAAATPTTPYSPMTAYILSAPSIDLTFPTQDSVPASPQGWMKGYTNDRGDGKKGRQGNLHPFASVLDAPSPPRPRGGMGAENEARRSDMRGVGKEESGKRGQENKSANQGRPALPPRRPLPHPSSTSRFAHPLRPKTPNGLPTSRNAILGPVDRQERTRGKVEVDLCPGMGIGGGVRPPKRGMDKSVSEVLAT